MNRRDFLYTTFGTIINPLFPTSARNEPPESWYNRRTCGSGGPLPMSIGGRVFHTCDTEYDLVVSLSVYEAIRDSIHLSQ